MKKKLFLIRITIVALLSLLVAQPATALDLNQVERAPFPEQCQPLSDEQAELAASLGVLVEDYFALIVGADPSSPTNLGSEGKEDPKEPSWNCPDDTYPITLPGGEQFCIGRHPDNPKDWRVCSKKTVFGIETTVCIGLRIRCDANGKCTIKFGPSFDLTCTVTPITLPGQGEIFEVLCNGLIPSFYYFYDPFGQVCMYEILPPYVFGPPLAICFPVDLPIQSLPILPEILPDVPAFSPLLQQCSP